LSKKDIIKLILSFGF
jgi:atrophin-1 interacting protein 5 (WW domain-containing E3 ubiquitin protein ligase 1)